MTLTSAWYALFLVCVAALYFILPKRLQNVVLLAASFVFYGFNLPKNGTLLHRALPILVLVASALFTFYIARAIDAADGKRRTRLMAAAVATCVLVLCVFKYFNLFLATALPFPLGISFYTFASISYIVDVYRRDMAASRDLCAYGVFISFFGTITSGPICRAKSLLPQLEKARNLDAQRVCDALRLMLFGFFKQIAIANVLGLYVNEIFNNMNNYSGLTLIFAAFVYAFQLYFEFAGYSDIARGSALLLGLDVPVNFKTPYFATNFSGFWNRWHISLSSWLQDYIFMPLVWSRPFTKLPVVGKRLDNGKPPVISSVALVFIISGFWHGNTLPFVIWGCLQALYRVGEELLHKYYKKPKKKPSLPLRIFKTVSVFILWTESLVFFRIGLLADGTVGGCFSYLARQFSGVSVSQFFADTSSAVQNGFYAKSIMVLAYFAFILLVMVIGIYTDWRQCFKCKDKQIANSVAALSVGKRWAVYYVLIALILAAFIMQSGGFGTASFAYAGF